jgi:hypothetical protein
VGVFSSIIFLVSLKTFSSLLKIFFYNFFSSGQIALWIDESLFESEGTF